MHTHTCVRCNLSVTTCVPAVVTCSKGHAMKEYITPHALAMALAAEGKS